jgi:hypothetical protein
MLKEILDLKKQLAQVLDKLDGGSSKNGSAMSIDKAETQ